MYKQAVALNKELHGGLRYTAMPGQYGFAVSAQFAPLVGSEAVKAAETLAIVFPAEGASLLPLALLGVRPGQNAYVDAQGQWLGGHVPVFMQRYPFTLAELPASGNASEASRRYALCVVADAPHFAPAGGLPLFTEQGEPGMLAKAMQVELAKVQADAERTQFMVKQLEDAGLLIAVPVPVVMAPGEAVAIKGVRILNIEKFRRLDAAQKKALEPSGALVLAQVHLHSLKNLAGGRLGEAARALAPAAAAAQAAAAQAGSLLQGAAAVAGEAARQAVPGSGGGFSRFLSLATAPSEEPK